MTPERFRRMRASLARRQPDLTVLMDAVHKPHNFSAILRTCDAVGIHRAHAVPPEDGMPLLNGVSASARNWVRVRCHPTVAGAVGHLRERGFRVVAAQPTHDAVDFRDIDYAAPTAVVLGTELHGVSDEAIDRADLCVRVPMAGMVPSLNVSVAAAVILYEAERQRRTAGMYDDVHLDPRELHRTLFEWAYPEVARLCRERGASYPRLDDDGGFLDPVPR